MLNCHKYFYAHWKIIFLIFFFILLIWYIFLLYFYEYNLLSNRFPYQTSAHPNRCPSQCPSPTFPSSGPPSTLGLFSAFKTLLWFASLPLCNFFPFPSPMVFCWVSQDPHMSENIWYLSFSDWLISLSIIFQFHPHCCKWQDFIFSHCQVVFHWIYKPHLLYPFVSWWAFRLFP